MERLPTWRDQKSEDRSNLADTGKQFGVVFLG